MLGHIGARGTAYWNVRLLDRLFDFDEIRVHSRRPESRDAFAARLERDLGKTVRVDRRLGVVRARRRHRRRGLAAEQPEPLLKTEWIKQGRLRRALRHDERGRALADRHHGQDRGRRLGPGAGRAVRRAARARRQRPPVRGNLHAELGQIVAGLKPGRERDDETILFWHRGLSLSDIALGAAMLEKARSGLGIGQTPALSLSIPPTRTARSRPSFVNARMYSARAGGARPAGKTVLALGARPRRARLAGGRS